MSILDYYKCERRVGVLALDEDSRLVFKNSDREYIIKNMKYKKFLGHEVRVDALFIEGVGSNSEIIIKKIANNI